MLLILIIFLPKKIINETVIKINIFDLKFFSILNLEIYIDIGIKKIKAIKLYPPYLKLG